MDGLNDGALDGFLLGVSVATAELSSRTIENIIMIAERNESIFFNIVGL